MSLEMNTNYLKRIKEIKNKIIIELKGTKEKVEQFQSAKKNVTFIYS